MKAIKIFLASLVIIWTLSPGFIAPAHGAGLSYVIQGVYQLASPVGSREWTVTLAKGREYEVALALYSPGWAGFTLAVADPWAQDYTFVSLIFYHSETSDDTWASTFTAPLSGQYTFSLASAGGTAEAIMAYFAVLDTGTIYNAHSHAGMPLADAHCANLSHTTWSYVLSLEGTATYFIDAARGDPSGIEVPVAVKAKVTTMGGLEIPALGETTLPWTAPACNETQPMAWAGDWFGVAESTTYNLVVEVSGLTSLDPVVVALTVAKEQAHGSTTPPDDDPTEDTGTTGLEVNLDGVMIVAAPCAVCLLVVAIAVVGTRRKRGVRGTAGVMKRDLPTEGW